MLKYFLLLYICIILPFCLFANDNTVWADDDLYQEEKKDESPPVHLFTEDTVWTDDELYQDEIEDDPSAHLYTEDNIWYEDDLYKEERNRYFDEPRKPPHSMNRIVEIGLLNLNIGFSNNFLSANNFFRETLVLNLDDLEKGLIINLGAVISPFFFNYNKSENRGFGISTGLNVTGNFDFSGNMLTFNEVIEEKSDIGGAVFTEFRLHFLTSLINFKIKIKPALYIPLLYFKPEISYTYNNIDDGTIFRIGYDFKLFTAWPQENFPNEFRITAFPGVDFHVGVEYPLSEVLNLSSVNGLLNFDLGLDIINVPIIPSIMKDYMELAGLIGREEPIDFFDDDFDLGSFVNSEEVVYGQADEIILRPFKILAWANWRPFGNQFVTFTPTLGFAVNPLYNKPVSPEAGIKTRINFGDMIIITPGIGYEDRLWKNAISFIFNLRIIQLDLGIGFQAQNFIQSWAGNGFGMDFGLKFGW